MVNSFGWIAALGSAFIAAGGCAEEVPLDTASSPFIGVDAGVDGSFGGAGLEPGGGGVYVVAGGAPGGMTGEGAGGMPSASGGDPGAGGAVDPNACPEGTKRCGGVCVSPQPQIGCSYTDCTACPPPPGNSTATCEGEACSFTCHEGFQLSVDGTACEVPAPPGAGGAGAGGAPPVGNGGSAPTCSPSSCPACAILLQPCCTAQGACGCEDLLGLVQCM